MYTTSALVKMKSTNQNMKILRLALNHAHKSEEFASKSV